MIGIRYRNGGKHGVADAEAGSDGTGIFLCLPQIPQYINSVESGVNTENAKPCVFMKRANKHGTTCLFLRQELPVL